MRRLDRQTALAIAWAVACGPLVYALLQRPGAAWTSILVYHAGCLAIRRTRDASQDAMPRASKSFRWRPQVFALAACSSAGVLAAGAAAASIWPALFTPNPAWARWGLAPPADLVWLAYYVTVNPWIEERFWRGALLDRPARAALGPRGALAFSCIAFGGHHAAVLVESFGAPLGALGTLFVLAAGAVWAALRWRTGSIALGVASHWGADLALALVYVLWWRA